tara:strand:- start:1689 stop:1907 length:219 start_codon:yes stop_codon:yes gene_type:complete
MANVVMNHAQFMSACKSADKKYRGKANVAQNDKSGTKVNQDLSKIAGKGTPSIQRYTKSYLTTVKNKSVVKK